MQNEKSSQPQVKTPTTPLAQPEPFSFNVIKPYTEDPATSQMPFLIKGVFKQGGLNSLVAKPKHGKSSFSRCAAVCVSKGQPFLGYETIQGEVVIISIEDAVSDINIRLKVLEYDPSTDAEIYLIDRVAHTFKENIAALSKLLAERPGVRLVVIDTLAKFVFVKRIEDYNDWLPIFEQLRQLGRDYPLVTILCLVHAKKVTGEDPFDSMLGSSALRGEFDTNAAIYKDGKHTLFTTETRNGKAIPPTVLNAQMVDVDGTDVVRAFTLGQSLTQLETEKRYSSERKRKDSITERVLSYLSHCENESAAYKSLIDEVEGKTETVIEAVNELVRVGTVISSGLKNSSSNPYTLRLNRAALPLHDFMVKFAPKEASIQ